MSTGTRIAQLRAERQWSQTALAQKVGINVKSVKIGKVMCLSPLLQASKNSVFCFIPLQITFWRSTIDLW